MIDTIKIAGFVRVKDFKGNPLQDRVTKFSYKYSEKEDDVCELTFESDDALLADRPEFQEGKSLTVSWGWLDNKNRISKERKIYIFDTDCVYEDNVKLTLTCHEKFVVAKMNVVSNKNKSSNKSGSVILSPEVLKAYDLQLEKGNAKIDQYITDDNKKSKAKNTITQIHDALYSGNMSAYRGLRDTLNKMPGGPYIIESRDDKVTIKARDFKQTPKRTWTWRGGDGELIMFRPQKKVRSKASGSSNVEVSHWNREKKTAYVQQSKADDAGQVKLTNSAVISNWAPQFDPYNKNKTNTNFAPTFFKNPNPNAVPEGGLLAKLGGKVDPNKKFKKVYVYTDYGKTPGMPRTVAIDNTAVKKQVEILVPDEPTPKKAILSTENVPEKAHAQAENIRKENEAENEMGSAEMLGEPEIECGQIVTFKGVSRKDNGNYYIFTCEHTIDEQGYILKLTEIGRHGKNTSESKIKTQKAKVGKEENFQISSFDKFYLEKQDDGNTRELYEERDGIYINNKSGPDTAQGKNTVKIPIKKAE